MAAEFGSLQLKNHFLLAMPGVDDPVFSHSITLLCEHSEDGAMGIVINRPLHNLYWRDVFGQLEVLATENCDQPVLAGGPVQMSRGFILHPATEQLWENSLTINANTMLTTSMDIINALAQGHGPPNSLLALGYAGWGAGQLEQELSDNVWLTLPVDEQILFDVPLERKAEAAAKKLGVDLDLLSLQAGHD